MSTSRVLTYSATASQNGQTRQVQIDANTGNMIPQ